MSDSRDRVLGYALCEVLRPSAEVDLSASILSRLAAGETIDLDLDLELEPVVEVEVEVFDELEPLPAPLRAVRWPRYAAAAAAVVLVAAGAFWLKRGPAEPPSLGRANGLVAVLDREGSLLGQLDAVEAGQALAVGRTVPVSLAIGEQATARLQPRTVLGLDAGATGPLARLELGALELDAGGATGLTLATDWAEVYPSPDAVLAAHVEVDGLPGPLATLAPAEVAAALARRRALPARVLTIRVEVGTARLISDGVELELRAGDERLVTSGGRVLSPLTADDEQLITKLFDATRFSMKDMLAGAGPSPEEAQQAMEQLSDELRERPHAWKLLRPLCEERWHDELAEPLDAQILLYLLALDDAPLSLDLGRAFWMDDPSAFEIEHMLGFAGRGADEFEREFRVLVADALESGNEEALWEQTLPAIHLAYRGDLAGLDAVERISVTDFGSKSYQQHEFGIAAALEHAGRRGAWRAKLELTDQRVAELLDGGQLESASRIVLTAEWFARFLEDDEIPGLLALPGQLEAHFQLRRPELQGAEAIRAVLDAL